MSAIQELIELKSKILSGEISIQSVKAELERISRQYGEDSFNGYKVNRKPKPWSKADLDELNILCSAGAGSKEFFLYMAEVSDYVYSQKKSSKPNSVKKKSLGICIGCIAAIVVVIGIILSKIA